MPGTGVLLLVTAACAAPAPTDRADDAAELLGLHEAVLRAHRKGDVAAWMAVEADTFVTVGRGRASSPPRDQRARQRAAYLERATFEVYRDVRPPRVRVSDDGTLGWVIAEVEIVGELAPDARPVAEAWGWVELYAKRDGRWRMVGNVANSRPLEAPEASPGTDGGR